MPRVSLGLTVFNSERYLEETIQSLTAQTFQDYEVIISDNASTDRTKEIALAYAARDARVRYVRNRINIGLAGNFNQVFRLSSGEYFKFAAHDDLYAPDFLLHCVEALDGDRDVVLAYPRTVGINDQGNPILAHAAGPDLTSPEPTVRFARIMRSPFWDTSLFGLIRAEVMTTTGLMPSNAQGGHVLLAELSLRGRFSEIPEQGFFFRNHPGRALENWSLTRRAQYMDPRLGPHPLRLRIAQVASYLSVIRRAPLDRWARVRCYRAVTRWLGDQMLGRIRGT